MINRGLVGLLRHPVHCCSLGFGSGLMLKAPGTWGTLMAVPFAWVFSYLAMEVYLCLIVLALLFGIWCCDKTAKKLSLKDPSSIVWDEFVGLWITLAFVPWERAWPLLGFLIFRVFDIFKPWPISFIDRRLSGGLGIMLDDVLAGIFSCALLQLIIHFA